MRADETADSDGLRNRMSVPGLQLLQTDEREEQPWRLHIAFHSPEAVYSEGEEVTGEVVADLSQDIVIERLTLSFSGLAEVTWPAGWRDDIKRKTNQEAKVEEESYLNQRLVLYNLEDARQGSGEEKLIVVPAGRHTYPFSIQLPHNLPSSFTGDRGQIKYTARTVLERPFQARIFASREFTVVNVLDLNTLPQAGEPVSAEASRQVGMMCCTTGKICVTWRLDSIGYVPGDVMRIHAELGNHSRIRVRKCKAMLIQHARYYNNKGGSHHERRVLVRQLHGEVAKGRVESWIFQMAIPPVPPTGLKICNLIDLWYTLKLSAQPHGPVERLEKSIDIIIGTVSRGEHAQTVFTGFAPHMTTSAADAHVRRPEEEALDLSYFI